VLVHAPGDRVYVLIHEGTAVVKATIQSVLDEEGGWYTLAERAGDFPRRFIFTEKAKAWAEAAKTWDTTARLAIQNRDRCIEKSQDTC
jgi:hypothetical protein